MKQGIHPDYVECNVRCSCGNTFVTHATKPELVVELCNNCHPFYTGQQKFVDTGGRVQRFSDKFGSAAQKAFERDATRKEAKAKEMEQAEEAKKAERERKAQEKADRAKKFEAKAAKDAKKAEQAAAEATEAEEREAQFEAAKAEQEIAQEDAPAEA